MSWRPTTTNGCWRLALVGVLLNGAPASAKTPRRLSALLPQLESLAGDEAKRWCAAVGIDYPPRVALFRAFKREQEMEIWAGREERELRLVRTVPICAVDEQPGPKLRPYDHKTPEGFYRLNFLFNSNKPWMWMKLDAAHLADYGVVGDGESFYLHVDYPNPVDRDHTTAAGFRQPKSQICVHGNCVSEGCISFTNRNFLFVSAFAAHHDAGTFGRPQLHIFPFRFADGWQTVSAAGDYVHRAALGDERLRRFWQNLQEGYELFNRTHRLLQFTYRLSSIDGAVRARYLFTTESPMPTPFTPPGGRW